MYTERNFNDDYLNSEVSFYQAQASARFCKQKNQSQDFCRSNIIEKQRRSKPST